MRNLVLYLLLLFVIPATAQPRPWGGHHFPAHSEHHTAEPLIKAGPHAHHGSHHKVHEMNPRDFDDALRAISNENFDEKRLTLAKHIVSNNPMSARQIASVCKLFSFESNRLEFAKHAYPHCIDKGMYFLVDETFTFSSSKDDLHDFIRHW